MVGLDSGQKAPGLSHDNGRFDHATSVITLSAKRDVMIVKLLACVVYSTVKQAVLLTSHPVTGIHHDTQQANRNTH